MNLPAKERAIIDRAKLVDYLLNTAHPVGRFKAAFFNALGFTAESFEVLEAAIRSLIAEQESELGETGEFGQKYLVAGNMKGPSGRAAQVVTIWIILKSEDCPRFVTAYPGSSK